MGVPRKYWLTEELRREVDVQANEVLLEHFCPGPYEAWMKAAGQVLPPEIAQQGANSDPARRGSLHRAACKYATRVLYGY